MSKREQIEQWMRGSGMVGDFHTACCRGFLLCFNRGEYYQAHDVLEHLWLRERRGADSDFYKALIQLAGGFVHLRKQAEHPEHPKHVGRLRPAVRLLRLAATYLDFYAPGHRGLDSLGVVRLCHECANRIEVSDWRVNPWAEGLRPAIRWSLPDVPVQPLRALDSVS